MASAHPLPLAIEDITTAWLEAAFGSTLPGVVLKDTRVVDVLHGTCTKIRVALDSDDPRVPATVIVKGGFEPHSRTMDFMHAHEVHSYADVAPLSPLRQPKCWFAGFDGGARQGIVVIEDLVARGVAFLHPRRPQAREQVGKRLAALARHHATSWGADDLFAPGGRFDWATSYVEGFYRYGVEVLTPPVWQGYVNSSRGAAASVRFHSLEWFLESLGTLVRHSAAQPKVLLHGDTHLGNLYIDTDGEPGFFDSQPHHGPAMAEVAYHVACALDPADRRHCERELIAGYRQALEALGIAPPPLDEMMRQYAAYLVLGYAIFLVNASDFQPEAINTAYTARFSAAMLDNDTPGVLARL